MLRAAVLLLVCADVGGSNWRTPPATRPDQPVYLWFRYAGDGEDDPIGLIARLQRDGLTDQTLYIKFTCPESNGDPSVATPGEDFVRPPEDIVLPAGVEWIDLPIPMIDDDVIEAASEQLRFHYGWTTSPPGDSTTQPSTQPQPATGEEK